MFPVDAVNGPRIKSDGGLAGTPMYFVRFWGQAKMMSARDIIQRIDNLPGGPNWVTLHSSLGDPATLGLDYLVRDLRLRGYRVAVETNGATWNEWLNEVDLLTVTLRTPTPGQEAESVRTLDEFVGRVKTLGAFSANVCDKDDLAWVRWIRTRFPLVGFYVTSARYRWLCEQTANDAAFANARVLPPLATL